MRAVLMGDPAHFSIRGGANPHTRNRLGMRRRVSRAKAIAEWHALARTLVSLDVRIFVIPPAPECPGLVYPANAGFLPHPAEVPAQARFYLLSNLIESRAAETPVYRAFLSALGFAPVPARYRFEGEADLVRAGDAFLFTCGRIERQRFVARFGLPPWRRVYGFRSDERAEAELAPLVAPPPILRIGRVDERYYHGDTVLCGFGARREHLLAYLPALAPGARALLEARFGGALIPLSKKDAAVYAANSFGVTARGRPYLIMPRGVTDALQGRVAATGVQPVVVDVGEFLAKGGGSVKCMIGDLGEMIDDPGLLEPDVVKFREERDYRNVYP
ncbi:MAG: dimethylarginine dimethylaminohydrolase family protein [Myxococcota bacterium]